MQAFGWDAWHAESSGRQRRAFGLGFEDVRWRRADASRALILVDQRPHRDHRAKHRQQLGLAQAQRKRGVLTIELDEEAPQRVDEQVRPEQHAIAREDRIPVEAPPAAAKPYDPPREQNQASED